MILPMDYASAPTQIVGAFYYFEEILIKVAVKAFFTFTAALIWWI